MLIRALPPASLLFVSLAHALQIMDMFFVEKWPLLFKVSLGVLLEMRPLLEVGVPVVGIVQSCFMSCAWDSDAVWRMLKHYSDRRLKRNGSTVALV